MFSNLNWILFVSQKAFPARTAAGGLKQGTPLGSLEGDLDPRPITRHWAGTTSTAVGGRGAVLHETRTQRVPCTLGKHCCHISDGAFKPAHRICFLHHYLMHEDIFQHI